MSVKRSNPKAILNLIKAIDSLDSEIMVGWVHPGEMHSGGLEMAKLAYMMEFGVRKADAPKKGHKRKFYKIPPRPMLRNTKELHGKEWVSTSRKLSKQVLDGKLDPEAALNQLGEKIKEDIRSTMQKSELYVPNAPSTERKKGFNTPLIDTRSLLNAVDYKIEKKGK